MGGQPSPRRSTPLPASSLLCFLHLPPTSALIPDSPLLLVEGPTFEWEGSKEGSLWAVRTKLRAAPGTGSGPGPQGGVRQSPSIGLDLPPATQRIPRGRGRPCVSPGADSAPRGTHTAQVTCPGSRSPLPQHRHRAEGTGHRPAAPARGRLSRPAGGGAGGASSFWFCLRSCAVFPV